VSAPLRSLSGPDTRAHLTTSLQPARVVERLLAITDAESIGPRTGRLQWRSRPTVPRSS